MKEDEKMIEEFPKEESSQNKMLKCFQSLYGVGMKKNKILSKQFVLNCQTIKMLQSDICQKH